MTLRIDPRVSALAAKRAEDITDGEIVATHAAIAADPRVSRLEYLGRALQGRPAFEIRATDCQQGELDGAYPIGAILNALRETTAGHAARLASDRARRVADTRLRTEARDAEEAEHEAEKAANVRRLFGQNIPPRRLGRIAACLIAGSYLSDEDLEDWAWYEREIVRGRPQPLVLHLYVAGFVQS